jgi:CubicO group peptidase (beta-lactamase class C family)
MDLSAEVSNAFDRAFAHVSEAIGSGAIPGAILGVIESGGARRLAACGHAAIEPEPVPMDETTWFDLASLTKVIFTTERILGLVAEGKIDLDAPLISVIPDLRQYDMTAWERRVTFRQCLGHQTAFPGVEPIYTYGGDPDRLRAFVLQREWRSGPPVYSDINFILLGIALERLEGRRIREMDPGPGFSFAPPPDHTAATERCSWRERVMRGEVHDENCYALQGSGHAGLFGTCDGVLDFAGDLLRRAAEGEPRAQLVRERISETRTHGWECAYPGWSGGDACGPDTIGHTGFTGTGLWLDFARGRAWTLLTNRVHPSRHKDSGIIALRRVVGECMNGKE